MLTLCERRGLWIKPARDCRHCHWYECEQHPRHIFWPAIKLILSKCPTMRRFRPDCKGKKIEWDGRQEHCARFRAMQGGKYGEHPCVHCALDRPCQHRGEPGESLLEWRGASKKRSHGDRYCITKTGKRFKVRIRCGGRQITVGTYGTIAEAKVARDEAILKSYHERADNEQHDTDA